MSENEGMFGGGMWIFALLILVLLGGGFGLGGARYSDFSSATSSEILFGQQFQGLDNKIDRIGNGLADVAYSLSGNINGVQSALGGMIADGHCAIQRNVDSVRFDVANYSTAIQNAIHEDGEKTRAMIYQNKVDELQQQVNQLSIQQAVCGIPKVSTFAWGTYPYSQPCGCSCGAM